MAIVADMDLKKAKKRMQDAHRLGQLVATQRGQAQAGPLVAAQGAGPAPVAATPSATRSGQLTPAPGAQPKLGGRSKLEDPAQQRRVQNRYFGYDPGEPVADKARKLSDEYEGDALGRRLARDELFRTDPRFKGVQSVNDLDREQARILSRMGLLHASMRTGPMNRILRDRTARLKHPADVSERGRPRYNGQDIADAARARAGKGGAVEPDQDRERRRRRRRPAGGGGGG